jgi:hypothetical protein
MLTIFSAPKPFKGHIGTIQRNAIHSWTLLDPRPEIILFGDDEGTAEVARNFDVAHVPEVSRNEFGTPLLNDLFDKAERKASNSTLCYVNADIVLLDDFMTAVERVSAWREKFLMVGRRWDLDIQVPIDFSAVRWQDKIRHLALRNDCQRPPEWIDYFVFTRGVESQLLPFAIGRRHWDNWLIWHACSKGVPAVDASELVVAIHQNHDYGHHPGGRAGVWAGEEAKRNMALVGGWWRHLTTADATHRLTANNVRLNSRRWTVKSRRAFWHYVQPSWFAFLNLTRPVRHRLGLRQRSAG